MLKAGRDWNDQLLDNLIKKVKNSWLAELDQLQNIRVSESLQQKKEGVMINLYIFLDVSQGAYSAAVYIRIEYKDQTVSVNLIEAKTTVALLHCSL